MPYLLPDDISRWPTSKILNVWLCIMTGRLPDEYKTAEPTDRARFFLKIQEQIDRRITQHPGDTQFDDAVRANDTAAIFAGGAPSIPMRHTYEQPAAPPLDVIAHAVDKARRSPCAKSRRGVVIFNTFNNQIVGVGNNHPPGPMACDGSEECRTDCRVRCVHAEAAALREAKLGTDGHRFDLLHVKVNNEGTLVSGGGPSCALCSKEILDSRIKGVWLFERGSLPGNTAFEVGTWRYYSAYDFHAVSCRSSGVHPFPKVAP